MKIEAQTAAGNALAAVQDQQVDGQSVTSSLQKVGDTFARANLAVEEGTSLWENVKKIAALLAPLTGGASVVASWFGGPMP